jgi:mRNA interferase RelE/StbE
MRGYKDKYKIRVGDYRIGVTVDKKSQTILCQRVAHHREIYQVFPSQDSIGNKKGTLAVMG